MEEKEGAFYMGSIYSLNIFMELFREGGVNDKFIWTNVNPAFRNKVLVASKFLH